MKARRRNNVIHNSIVHHNVRTRGQPQWWLWCRADTQDKQHTDTHSHFLAYVCAHSRGLCKLSECAQMKMDELWCCLLCLPSESDMRCVRKVWEREIQPYRHLAWMWCWRVVVWASLTSDTRRFAYHMWKLMYIYVLCEVFADELVCLPVYMLHIDYHIRNFWWFLTFGLCSILARQADRRRSAIRWPAHVRLRIPHI